MSRALGAREGGGGARVLSGLPGSSMVLLLKLLLNYLRDRPRNIVRRSLKKVTVHTEYERRYAVRS